MQVINKVEKYIQTHHLFTKQDKLLLAVSSGMDSILMLHILHQLKFEVAIAHCNFQLRGNEAEEDEKCVENLAQALQIPFHSIRFNTKEYAQQQHLSIQVAARNLRYDWFYKICKENNYTKICTAHHLNDQTETILLNLCKGTGLKGMTGIPNQNNKVVRPFLGISKAEIIEEVHRLKLNYREDASNAQSDYQRNFIRHQIIPKLISINPSIHHTFENNSFHFSEGWQLQQYAIASILKKLIVKRKNNIFISIPKLFSFPSPHTLLDALLTQFNFSHKQVVEALKILDAAESKQIINEKFKLLKSRNILIITPIDNVTGEGNDFILIKNESQQVNTAFFTLKLEKVKFKGIQNKSNAWFLQLDFEKIIFPLVLRKWKNGDYFYPLGLNKKKKISDFLTDKKLNVLEKENTYVLLSTHKIIAVLQHSIDHRYAISNPTKYSLELVLKMK